MLGICDDPANETELEGLTVFLYTSGGERLGSTVTDAGGNYSFTNLPAGSYRVVLGTTEPPLDTAELTTTADDTPATTLTNTGTSVIQDVTIVDTSLTDIDFAFIRGVYFDYGDLPAAYGATLLAQDGARHAIPTNGISLYYLGTVPPDANVDGMPSAYATGDDLSDGSDDEDGVVPVNIGAWAEGSSGGSVQVTVCAPSNATAYLIGWIDFNHDGDFLDADEMVVNTSVSGTGSPAAAIYSFDIPAGALSDPNWLARFRVFAEQPPFPVIAYTGVAADGEVEDHLLTSSAVALGDRVWEDLNANGVQDVGEPGLTNVTVRLYNDASEEVAVTLTDASGLYLFDNLPAGSYSVAFEAPALYLFTVQDAPAATDETDSDADASTGSTALVGLTTGTTNLTLDAGLYMPALLFGYVFKDSNTNLLRDTGDGTITNALVRLVSGGIVVASTNTDSTGYYRFENIPSGTSVSILVSRAGGAYLVAVPTNEPAASDQRRNRALGDTNEAYIVFNVVRGYGYIDEPPAETLNFGFETYPFSTAIDFRVYADGSGGVLIDLWTVNESGAGDITVYAWMGNAWVEVGRVPASEVVGEGSNRYTIRSSVLPPEGSYYFRIVDEAGHVHDSPTPVSVTVIAMQALRFDMQSMVIGFNTEYGCRYLVKVCDDVGANADGWTPEFVSVLRDGVWSDYSDQPFMAGPGTQTQVRVPVNRRKAFYKIELMRD